MRLFILYSVIFICCPAVNAQTIHWITFTDTAQDDAIGSWKMLNSKWINVVNAALAIKGYRYDIQDFCGILATKKNCEEVIKNLKSWPEDIIVFYYIGHGGRSIDKRQKFPKLKFVQSEGARYELSKIHDQLKSKNARLTITIGMCCNYGQEPPSDNLALITYYGENEKPLIDENIQDLFLKYKGDIIISSAKPNEYSFGGWRVRDLKMDFFTYALIKQFGNLMSQSNFITWESLMNSVRDKVVNMVEYCQKKEYLEPWKTQEPQYKITLEKISDSTILHSKNRDCSNILINPFLKNICHNPKIINLDTSGIFKKAERLYLEKNYDEAFPLFRKLAYDDRSAFKAQYYTALMEFEGKGCKFMDPQIRVQEASRWCLKGAILALKEVEGILYSCWQSRHDNEESYEDWLKIVDFDYLKGIWRSIDNTNRKLYALANRLMINEKKIPYYGTNKYSYFLIFERPMNKGWMITEKRNKFGYINEKNEKKIKPMYDCVYGFNDNGIALVQKDNLFAYIDTIGEQKLGKYISACNEFRQGKTFVIQNNILHLITEEGIILRKISGYKDIIRPALDEYVLVTNDITGKDDLFDFYGNLIEVDCKLEYRADCTMEVYKNDKLIYSCFKNW